VEVRRLRQGEGARIRQVRLRALRDAPYAFSSSFEREADDPADVWEGLDRGLGFAPTGEQRPLPSDPSLTEVFMSRPL
jgi:hypothetical protein